MGVNAVFISTNRATPKEIKELTVCLRLVFTSPQPTDMHNMDISSVTENIKAKIPADFMHQIRKRTNLGYSTVRFQALVIGTTIGSTNSIGGSVILGAVSHLTTDYWDVR